MTASPGNGGQPGGTAPRNPPQSDIRAEAERLAALTLTSGLSARLLGGLAIWLRCPSVRTGPYARGYDDMDFAVAARSAGALKDLLIEQGYQPDKFFNGLHGESRLYFAAPDGRWSIDVIIDELTMSHRLDLRGRLGGPAPTITLADLLLSKLQVVQINKKDLGDALCLLADHRIGDDDADPEVISAPRLAEVLGSDWGFCHTTEHNIGKLAGQWAQTPVPEAGCDVPGQLERLSRVIEAAPKTRGWRMRSRIGERVRWYQTPEEVGH